MSTSQQNEVEVLSVGPLSLHWLVALALLVGCVSLYIRRIARAADLPLPPGPPGLLVIGNLFSTPQVQPWLKYQQWHEKYGDIVHLSVLGQSVIILGSVEACTDLMDKRSSIYSDRPISVLDAMIGWDWPIGFVAYGPRWRQMRRTFHRVFNINVVGEYREIHERHVRNLLGRILQNSGSFNSSFLRVVMGAEIGEIVYGITAPEKSKEYILMAESAIDVLNESRIPGGFWADFLPFVRYIPSWVPGAESSQFAKHARPKIIAMKDRPFDAVKIDVECGSETSSVVHDIIRNTKSSVDATVRYDVEREAFATAYLAAVDITIATMSVCLIAMAMYPEVQRKAQQELDSVVGSQRLPTFADWDSLPYVKAVLMESPRWMPVVPFSIPHRVMVEDEYRGYRIPKGSVIIPNAWGMLQNPLDYPDPGTFNPDRYILNGEIDDSVRDPGTIAFGFGRRICPGRHLANDLLFLAVASMLHSYEISAARDSDGRSAKLSSNATTEFFSYPESLPLTFKSRRRETEVLLARQCNQDVQNDTGDVADTKAT